MSYILILNAAIQICFSCLLKKSLEPTHTSQNPEFIPYLSKSILCFTKISLNLGDIELCDLKSSCPLAYEIFN